MEPTPIYVFGAKATFGMPEKKSQKNDHVELKELRCLARRLHLPLNPK